MNPQIKIDLSNCDKEPVAFIGSVQSFGGLIAVNKTNHLVTHISSNIKDYLGLLPEECLGKSRDELLSSIDHSKLHTRQYENDEVTIYEIEKVSNTEVATMRNLLEYMEELRKAEDLKALLFKAVDIVYKLTGQDRIMIYKFHEDLHGEVVSERVEEGVEPFMGLHYPATDIPGPARELFRVNWLRMIENVSAQTYPITSQDNKPLDLTKSLVRAVSPIHIEYLKNMDVQSSLTISLRVGDGLWGLIACHNKKPRYFSPEEREACEMIGRTISLLIHEFERREYERHLKKLSVIHQKLISNIHNFESMGEELTTHTPNLLSLIDSEGAAAALSINGKWVTIGDVPNEKQLDDLASWLSEEHSGEALFHTNELATKYPPASEYSMIGSGLLAVCIPKTSRNYIMWFKPEYVETVVWAGNPNNKVLEGGRLSPRKSFSDWTETVRGKSRPWRPWECEAALELRNSVIALDLRHQFRKEQVSRTQAEDAVRAREELLSIVSHDLKNPLSSILINSQLINRLINSENEKVRSLIDKIGRSAKVMNNLIEDILNVTKLEANRFTLDLTPRKISEVISEVVEILSPLAKEKSIQIEEDLDEKIELKLDHGRILQVISNILGNAIKFTPKYGRISITAKKHEEGVLVSISDTGPGIPKENLVHVFDRYWQAKQTSRMGTGLGLAIAKEIISAHNGRIWVESELGKGSTFSFIFSQQLD